MSSSADDATRNAVDANSEIGATVNNEYTKQVTDYAALEGAQLLMDTHNWLVDVGPTDDIYAAAKRDRWECAWTVQ